MRYRVTGIVQVQIHDGWTERVVRTTVRADTAEQARQRVLSEYADVEQVHARWHRPECVRAEPLGEEGYD